MREGCREVARRIGIFREVGRLDRAFDITAEIRTSGVLQGDIRAFVDTFAFLELHFRAVEDTGDTTVGEHQRQVLRPGVLRLGEAVELHLVRRVVVRVHIHHIPCRVVIIFVVGGIGDVPCLRGAGEVPMYGEVDDVQTGGLRIVGRMVGIALQERILRGWLGRQTAVVILGLLPDGLPVGVRGAGRTFHLHELVP